MKKIFILLSVSFLSFPVFSQDNQFLIYSFKGNVSVVENNTETKAKIGKIISGDTKIKLASASSVTMVCNQAAMFTIKKAGNYSLSQFKDSCVTHNSSMTANYFRYVWNQLTSHNEGTPGTNRKMFMNTVGAVSRSVNNIWIDPRLDTVNYCSGDFPLSWKSYADAEEFEFSLSSDADAKNSVYKTIVKKKKISIPDFTDKMKTGNTYYWTAAVKGEQNDELKALNFVPKEKYEALLNTFKAQGPANETAAEQYYRIAFMLEDSHFLSEAYQYYLKAATAEPDNTLFRSTLMSFKKDYEIK